MDQAIIDDLKQFIATTVSQQVSFHANALHGEISKLRADMEKGFRQVHEKFEIVEHKIDNLSDSVGEALDTSNEETGRQLNDHEVRLTKLEAKAAL